MQQPDATPEPTTKSVEITVHVCPAADCNAYHGSTNAPPNPEQLFSGPMVENRERQRILTGSREKKSLADCPECFHRKGIRVQRVPITTRIQVPLLQPDDKPVPLPVG